MSAHKSQLQHTCAHTHTRTHTYTHAHRMAEPARTLRQFTDPPLNACRGIIPAIGGIDLSPMLLFFGLSFLSKQLKLLAIGA